MLRISCLLLPLLASACSTHSDYTITPVPAGPPLVGFGAQMNAYTYYGHNWADSEANESNIADYEDKVQKLRPQHVRIFVQPEWWTGGPDIRDSIIRTIALAQRAGATVNLTFWHGPYPNIRRQMHDFAKMIRDLRIDHGFTNIKYITIQNEPNSFDMPMERYNRIYWTFDEEARSAGIRNDIQIIGGDLLSDHQAAWFRNLSDHLAPVLDGYSVHMYQDYWDRNHQLARVTEVPLYVNNLPPAGRKPVYLMEFGLRGVRQANEEPGKHRNGEPLYDTPESAMLNGWRMMEALNRGYVAMVWWDLADVRYDKRRMYYGLIGEPAKGWPLKPGYYLMYLFTHTTQPGSRALQVKGASSETLVSATQSKKGDMTAYALNRSDTPRRITIAGLPRQSTLHQLTWNGSGNGKLLDSGSLQTDLSGSASLTLPPMSITALASGRPAR